MRILVLVVLGVVLGAAAFVMFGMDDAPLQEVQGQGMQVVNGTIVGMPHQCAHCHMGYMTPWQETITNTTFELRPLYHPVYAIQVLQEDEQAVLFESGPQRRQARTGQTVGYNFQVPDNTSAIYARAHGMPGESGFTLGQQTQNFRTHYELAVTLSGPSDQYVVDGPEDDLHIGVILDPEPGPWRLNVLLQDGELPEAQILMLVELLGGDVTPSLQDASQGLTVEIDNLTRIRARPYTDHGAFETVDWDGIDISPYVRTLWLQNETYEAPIRDEPVRDNLHHISTYTGHLRRAYVESSQGELGFGTNFPLWFKLAQAPVRNTTMLEIDLTWSPALELLSNVRYSTGASPYYYDAELTSLSAGRASFTVAVAEYEWDPLGANPCMNKDPNCQFYSYWDFAPQLWSEPASVMDVDWRMVVTAT